MIRVSADLCDWNDASDKVVIEQFEVVAELDEPDMSYEFNTLRIYRHKPSGRVWWCGSSGCSCPIPFEEWWFDVDGEAVVATEMNELVEQTLADFEREASAFPGNDYGGQRPYAEDVRKFIAAGRDAVAARNKEAGR